MADPVEKVQNLIVLLFAKTCSLILLDIENAPKIILYPSNTRKRFFFLKKTGLKLVILEF